MSKNPLEFRLPEQKQTNSQTDTKIQDFTRANASIKTKSAVKKSTGAAENPAIKSPFCDTITQIDT